jgi:lysyl-tRNA synthetase class 2
VPPDATPRPVSAKSTEELIADRRRKLDKLRELGHDPFGGRTAGVIALADAHDRYDPAADEAHQADVAGQADDRPRVRVAGRVVQLRQMGNLVFASLRDPTGDLQVAISKKAVGPDAFKAAKLLDYADLLTVYGPLAKTKTGETTVWAETDDAEASGGGFALAAKSLALPPDKHKGLTDPETRYRKRYVDLYANPETMALARQRIAIIDAIRRYMTGRGFVEVETPMLQAVQGGATARPFTTHHNALDLPLYLRIAPELYLKRLLVAGMPKVFEINRNFRNEGVSPRHNPEFTMLEAYEAYGSWETMAELVEDMICTVAEQVCGGLLLNHRDAETHSKVTGSLRDPGESDENAKTPSRQDAKGGTPGRTIDLRGDKSKPRGQRWRRVSMAELVEERTGWKFDKRAIGEAEVDRLRDEHPGKDLKLDGTPAEQLTEVYEKLVEPTLIDPCFVTRVPGTIIPLAKRCEDDDYFADVYELAINGVEISPGYTELNDPDVQEAQFRQQVGDEAEQQDIDEDFLEALRVGMPPAGGIGLGIDRLVMMLTGATSIRDVILFPLMRPKD